MAEQAAIGQDAIDLADALKIQRFAVAGYDRGGRAACIAAALNPDRVRAAVLISGYTIQNVFATPQPAPPERERALRYQSKSSTFTSPDSMTITFPGFRSRCVDLLRHRGPDVRQLSRDRDADNVRRRPRGCVRRAVEGRRQLFGRLRDVPR